MKVGTLDAHERKEVFRVRHRKEPSGCTPTLRPRRPALAAWPFLAAALVAILSCGSPGTPTLPAREALTLRAQALTDASNRRDWEAVHRHFSPRWASSCSADEYGAFIEGSLASFRQFMGIPDEAVLSTSVRDVSVSGEEGIVNGRFLVDGEPLPVGQGGGDRWVLVHGQWYAEPENRERGCGP